MDRERSASETIWHRRRERAEPTPRSAVQIASIGPQKSKSREQRVNFSRCFEKE